MNTNLLRIRFEIDNMSPQSTQCSIKVIISVPMMIKEAFRDGGVSAGEVGGRGGDHWGWKLCFHPREKGIRPSR